MAKPVQITDTNFRAEVLQNDRVVLTSFWSEWNTPSQKLLDTLQKVATELAEQVKVTAANIDEAPATVSEYRVLNVPTVIAFKNGVPVKTLSGSLTAAAVKKAVAPYLPPE